MPELEELIQKVADKIDEHNRDIETLKGRPDPIAQDEIATMVRAAIDELTADPEFGRKMRFGRGEPELMGTKYARWGLSPADVEFLHDLMVAAQGQPSKGRVHPGPSEELTRAFNAVSEAFYLPQDEVRRIDRAAIDDLFPRVNKRNMRQYEAAMRAMDSAESGYGSQLIGAQYVGELWEAARPLNRLFPLIDTFEMQHPTAYLPVEADLAEMLFVAENTANNSSDYTTDKTGSNRVQVDAKKFIIHQMWSGEMEEDSIIPYIPFLRRQAALSIAYYTDSLILNGDTTNAGSGNINLDDADPADTKHYLAFDGIRHAGLVDNTANKLDIAGALAVTNILALRALMADSAANAPMHWGYPAMNDDLVLTTDYSTYQTMINWDEVVTVDKYGPSATILTGELGRIWNIPIIPTQVMSLTQSDGLANASSNTLGQVALFNRRAFKVGWRRRIQLETERLPGRDQTRLIYSMRLGFGRYSTTGAASGIEAAAVGYNITV